MAANNPFCLLLLLPFILFTAVSVAPVYGKAPPYATGNDSSEFIRTSCGVTLYPDLCFTSLSGYASAVKHDPVQLARVAASVSLARVRSVSARVASLSRKSSAASDKMAAAALRDCVDSLGDAADDTRQAAVELQRLAAAVGPEVAWRVSNAETWMSAALTNEDTCTDGFEGVGPGPVKDDVGRRVQLAKQYTSNALALVNHLVAGGRR